MYESISRFKKKNSQYEILLHIKYPDWEPTMGVNILTDTLVSFDETM